MIQLAKRFLLIYLLLKPFYLFGSGGLQIGDIFLVLSFILLVISAKVNKRTKQDFTTIIKSNKLFILFVAATLIINLIYFTYYGEFKFILSTLYFIFNLLAILTFSSFFKDEVFLQKVSKVFKFNLIIQLLIFVTGIGRYYSLDRYMGTFNDPNQFGYYIFISFLFIYVIKILLSRKENNILYFILSLFLIVLSASTGMLLGLAIFLLLLAVHNARNYLHLTYVKFRKIIHVSSLLVIILTPLCVLFLPYITNDKDKISSLYEENSIVERVTQKVSKAENDADISIWEDRGYDIIFKYPINTIYGAGEGAYTRFSLATNNFESEIHATLPSILFYYGIIPFILLVRWLYLKVKDNDPRILIAYAALFAESFTLLNQRQALFWMIIILGGLYSRKIMRDRPYENQ